MDVEFEEVVDRIGQRDGAILRCRMAVFQSERSAGLLAGIEGYVLEVAIGICDLRNLSVLEVLNIKDGEHTCSPVSIVLLRHATGMASPYLQFDSASAPRSVAKKRYIADSNAGIIRRPRAMVFMRRDAERKRKTSND